MACGVGVGVWGPVAVGCCSRLVGSGVWGLGLGAQSRSDRLCDSREQALALGADNRLATRVSAGAGVL